MIKLKMNPGSDSSLSYKWIEQFALPRVSTIASLLNVFIYKFDSIMYMPCILLYICRNWFISEWMIKAMRCIIFGCCITECIDLEQL